ncbi:MAG: anti-sigma factor [Pseudomonadota bacterium]
MSQEEKIERDDPMIAAEYSLGLLEGEDLLFARGKMTSEAAFAARKDWWDNWFVPLSDEIAGAEPGDHVWTAITDEIGASAGDVASARANAGADTQAYSKVIVLDLQRQVRRWQWAAGIASAAAALALALFVTAPGAAPVAQSEQPPTIAATQAPLMASIPVGDTLRLSVTFLPGSDEMLVSAAGLTADGVHDHELWLVPADGGALQSLGVVVPGEERRVALPSDIAANMGDGVELVLTREPLGGKPDGREAGPVVAQGAFGQV